MSEAYLARALAALTPAGRARVDELLDQLAALAGGHDRVRRFAAVREAEADSGREAAAGEPALGPDEISTLLAGFKTIRDQEPLDDVADWANAVVLLLEDER
jgi:hypothetical protein